MNHQQQLGSIFISISGITVQKDNYCLLENITLSIHQQQQWAFIGNSGSGKTTLAHVLSNTIFYRGNLIFNFPDDNNRIELVAQQHHFKTLSNTNSFYYQQRFNASDAEDSMTVAAVLENYKDEENWIAALHLTSFYQKPVIQLSNGENKRLQLAKALLARPALLILDNPFTGLDAEGRKTLHTIFEIICKKGIHLILITSPAELPACITHVAVLEKGKLLSAQKKEDYLQAPVHNNLPVFTLHRAALQQLQQPAENDFDIAVKMDNVCIRYGEKTILNNINWKVRKGECWNLSGANGSGKSTLLSLITADNPQAYANKIILFDKKRGSGESIWDIKRKIGFVSPELHIFFELSATCFEVIASGLFDTIGLFRRLSENQEASVLLWMRLMELSDCRYKRIAQLSTGQQRMALLARAMVKNPPLLILDEPTQGLDETQAAYFKSLVNEICNYFTTTLIYVSHYTSDLPACIQYYLQLNNGVIV